MHCGRADWLQFWHEITPYEYAYLQAFNQLESFGDDREDARVKFMTAQIINRTRFGGDGVELADLEYLKRDDTVSPAAATPNQAAMVWQAATGVKTGGS